MRDRMYCYHDGDKTLAEQERFHEELRRRQQERDRADEPELTESERTLAPSPE